MNDSAVIFVKFKRLNMRRRNVLIAFVLKAILVSITTSLLNAAPLPAGASRQDVKGAAKDHTPTYFDDARSISRASVIRIAGIPEETRKDVGFSMDFSKGTRGADGVKNVKNVAVLDGKLNFVTGKDAVVYWGNPMKEAGIEPLSIGAGLNDRWYPLRLMVRMKQSLPRSKWKVEYSSLDGSASSPEVIVKGTEWQNVEFSLGDNRGGVGGDTSLLFALSLTTPDPDNHVQIEVIKAYTPSVTQCFRAVLDLPDEPVEAAMDILKGPQHKLFINGKLAADVVYGGGGVDGRYGSTYNDLKRYFKKGRNVIAVESEYHTWAAPAPDLALDGMVRLRDGRVMRILSDGTWKGAFNAQPGWWESGFADDTWSPVMVVKAYHKLTGVNYGPITLQAPVQDKYFIFDAERPVVIPVRVAAEVADGPYDIIWRLRKPDDDKDVKSGVLARACEPVKVFSGVLKAETLEPGVYEVFVDLTLDGKIVESRVEEIAVVGKIPQREVRGTSYTEGLDLELTDDIDLTNPNSPYKVFSQTLDGRDIPAPIVEGKAGKYRESGGNCFDWFGVAVKHAKIYDPYLVEVEIPDDAQRVMSVRTMEMTAEPGNVMDDATGCRGWALAAPGVHMGIEHRLTHKMKTLRYIIYPKVPVTGFCFMTQRQGVKAAASRMRIYHIKNDLPAARIASESHRFTGQHLERIDLVPYTFLGTQDEFKFAVNYSNVMHRGFYKNWYNSIENMVKYMRFTGENMLIAGLYMYHPENSIFWRRKEDTGIVELMGRMCAANGIRVLLGVEYSRPEGRMMPSVTDAEVAAGARTFYAVSKNGNQAHNWCGTASMFVPEVRQDILNITKDMLGLYKDTPGIDGLVFQEGRGWLPGLSHTVSDLKDPLDWGYDDITVSQFEKDEGTKVPGEAKDPGRFMVRYRWVMKNAREKWINWWNQKVYELNKDIAQVMVAGNPSWKMYIFPRIWVNDPKLDTPLGLMRRASFTPSLYMEDKSMVVGGVYENRINTPANMLDQRMWSNSPDILKISDEHACYVGTGFFESEQHSKTWYWAESLCADYVWQSGRDFLYPFSRVLSASTPSFLAQTWLDVNMMVGFEQERREFNRAFRVLPPGPYGNLAGNGFDENLAVRLSKRKDGTAFYIVNRSGWPVSVDLSLSLSTESRLRDLVLGDVIPVQQGGRARLPMQSYEMRSFEIIGKGDIIGARATVSADAAEELKGYALEKASLYAVASAISEERLTKGIKTLGIARSAKQVAEEAARITSAAASGDYLSVAVLTDSCLSTRIEGFLKAMKEYLSSSKILKSDYHVNCGAEKDYIDTRGNTWLADSPWMDGAKDWGYMNGSIVDRGAAISVAGATDPTIYRTERYGLSGYGFHLPKGTYKVKLYFAETYDAISPGDRVFNVLIQGRKVLDEFDICKQAGGRNRALVKEFTASVEDDTLLIEFEKIKDSPKIDGIEIQKNE